MHTDITKPNIGRRCDCTFPSKNQKIVFISQIVNRNQFGIFVSDKKNDEEFDVQIWFDGIFESGTDYEDFCEAIDELIQSCWWQVIPFEK